MSNYAIITDLNRCTGCLACTVAVSYTHLTLPTN